MTTSTLNRVTAGKLLAIALLVAALAASLILAAQPAHASTTFTVTNTNDSGAGSLRQAINDANNMPGADVIEFDIPGSDVHTIAPVSQLPTITGPVTINGYSQPGAQPNQKVVGSDAALKIELNGSSTQNGYGLVMGASNSTFKGLIINGWNQGVRIDGTGSAGNRIAGNFIGTDASGTQGPGNGVGVRVYEGSSNTIGGTTPAARNVISGNGVGVGIGDGGPNTTANKVVGNYIGTDATGTRDLGNSHDGVYTEDTPDVTTNSIIGGATAAERNVISGNDESGVSLYGSGSKVLGNYIGTDATGTKDLGDTEYGVSIQGGENNTVGGTQAGERNVVSGNFVGVLVEGAAATGNMVTGNYVGTDKNGTAPLGNDHGVLVTGASGNTVGGTSAAARNVISASRYYGVGVFGDTATGNRILSNSIFANDGLGIDLLAGGINGRTYNDPGDVDTGPNYLQNFPVLSSAKKGAAGKTTVRGTLDSTPNATFRVQFFSNPKGTDEGKTPLGSVIVSTDGAGDASFAFSTSKTVKLEQNITATATGPWGNTSEFSAPKKVVAG